MKEEFELNQERLNELSEKIHRIATEKGWHEDKKTDRTWMMLVITEVCEAVEADRNDKRAKTDRMKELLRVQEDSAEGLSEQWYSTWFTQYYDMYIKGSIEEELADVVIRLLDFVYERYGKINYRYHYYDTPRKNACFADNAEYLVKEVINSGTMNIASALYYVYIWAQQLDIDLEWHILQKMEKNRHRPYRHGGKKY